MKKYKGLASAVQDAPKIAMKKVASWADIVGHEFLKDCDAIIPKDTSTLSKSGQFTTSSSESQVKLTFNWATPYAKRVYYVTALTGSLKWAEVNAFKNKMKYQKMFKK